MLIKDLNKYLKDRKGAIHIGANDGGERDWYVDNGFRPVLWFEPNYSIYKNLCNNISLPKYNMHFPFNRGVHDTMNKAILHVSNNNGESSSILPFGLHSEYYPKIKYINAIEINLIRMDDFFNTEPFNINDFNFLNIDVQGCELNVIRSFGQDIGKLDYIYTEVNTAEVYEGCSLLKDIDLYLNSFGFIRVETKMTKNQWGDAFYINTLKNEA